MAEQRVQRRLAAILAADVVGYSRLMEADEEGTRARLRKVQSELIDPQIAADGGVSLKPLAMAYWWSFQAPWTLFAMLWQSSQRWLITTPIYPTISSWYSGLVSTWAT